MTRLICQCLLVAYFTLGFFINVHSDFHDTEAKPAKGFNGFVTTFIASAIVFVVLYFAGAFSELVGATP